MLWTKQPKLEPFRIKEYRYERPVAHFVDHAQVQGQSRSDLAVLDARRSPQAMVLPEAMDSLSGPFGRATGRRWHHCHEWP
jgi:hypothetical protein